MADITRNTAHNLGIDTSGFNADNMLLKLRTTAIKLIDSRATLCRYTFYNQAW
ncbi:MAG: hypothetical protein IJT73_07165 [Selenomonadaceae bacterium]|nr:hypothetical protein [Selenomonadaceae bacterium]